MDGIGKRIKELRLERGLTQCELAKMIGLSEKSIIRYENNNVPGLKELLMIAGFFNVRVEYLTGQLSEIDIETEKRRRENENKLNGYRLLAHSYENLVEIGDGTEEDVAKMKRKAYVLHLLSLLEGDDKYYVFDSGMFNDIFKGYVELLTEGIDEESARKVRDYSRNIYNDYSAKQAEEKYYGK